MSEPRIYLLLMRLRALGGSIVREEDCTPNEVAIAMADGRHTADKDGHGYVWRPAVPSAPM